MATILVSVPISQKLILVVGAKALELRLGARIGTFCGKLLHIELVQSPCYRIVWELFKKDVFCTKVTPFTKSFALNKKLHF